MDINKYIYLVYIYVYLVIHGGFSEPFSKLLLGIVGNR